MTSSSENSVELADTTKSPEGFMCIATSNGKIYNGKTSISSFDSIMKENNLDDSNTVKIEIIPDNSEKYPYLYPDKNWKTLVYGKEIPSWLDTNLLTSISSSFQQWKEKVYGCIDCSELLKMTADDTINASPKDDYVLTDEDKNEFAEFVKVYNSLYTYIRTSVKNTIDDDLGTSLSDDAWNFVNDNVSEQVKQASNIGTLLKDMGTSNVGAVQNDFIGAVIGSYFSITDWKYCTDSSEDYPYQSAVYLWKHGLTVSEDSDGNWRLHAANGGKILDEISAADASVNKAFACVVDSDGKVYWKESLDTCDAVKNAFSLTDTSKEYLDIQVKPVLSKDDAQIPLPDGNNPNVTRIFPYLDDASSWTLIVLDNGTPEWFSSTLQSDVMSAFNEWKAETYSALDFEKAKTIFTEATKQVSAYNNDDIKLLKEWAVAWHNVKDKGLSPTATINLSGYSVVGKSVWDDVDQYLLASWRVQHQECPGSVVTDISGFPYQAAADLIEKGLVPCTDGEKWYLCSGENAKVIFSISENDLLNS